LTNVEKIIRKFYHPTSQELELARSFVVYELRMLFASVDAYFDPKRSRENACIGSAFTDSILLHVRNLYDFLTGEPKKLDDIIAEHFVNRGYDSPWKSSKLTYLESRMNDINKYRSHLTYSRRMGNDKPKFDTKKMRNVIAEAFQEFIEVLSNSERLQWERLISNQEEINNVIIFKTN